MNGKVEINLWLYDIVIIRKSKEVMSWVYNYFKKLLIKQMNLYLGCV